MFSLLFFLIPTALVSAELATGWPEEGGVFRWVSEAFGKKWGFLAIWLQWVQNVIWYPTVLAFAAGALAYLFGKPELAANAPFSVIVILVTYWLATWINLHGIKAAGWLSTLGVIIGTILPGILIIFLGLIWLGKGERPAFLDGSHSFFPDFSDFSTISLLAGVILLFAGMEVNAVHANEVKNPRKSYPIAILISVVIIFTLFLIGSLSVGAVIPIEDISLTAGVMQAFQSLLMENNITWLVPILGLFLAFGVLGGIAAWIVGPSRGLLATAKEGLIPPWLAKTNKKGIPSHILFCQGVLISILSLLYLVTKTVSGAFFILSALAVILYLLMYLLLFCAALRLRYSEPTKRRAYRVPGKMFGMWFVCGVGILGALFAIVIGFFPPSQLPYKSPTFYVLFLGIGSFVALIAPKVILHYRKPSWKQKAKRLANDQ